MLRPLQLASLVLVLVGAFQVAAAASLTAAAARLGVGTAPVLACDGDGFVFKHVIDTAGRITSVTVSGIDASCGGGTLRLTLVNGSAGVGSGSVGLPSSGFTGTATVTVSPQPASTAVTAVSAVVEGP